MTSHRQIKKTVYCVAKEHDESSSLKLIILIVKLSVHVLFLAQGEHVEGRQLPGVSSATSGKCS